MKHMTDPNTTGGATRLAIRWAARAINPWRLRGRPDHQQRDGRSHHILAKLRSRDLQGQPRRCFGYLRKVDHSPSKKSFSRLSRTPAAPSCATGATRVMAASMAGACYPAAAGDCGGCRSSAMAATSPPGKSRSSAPRWYDTDWPVACSCTAAGTGALSDTTARTVQVQVVSGDGLLALLLHRHLPRLRGQPHAMRQAIRHCEATDALRIKAGRTTRPAPDATVEDRGHRLPFSAAGGRVVVPPLDSRPSARARS